MDQKEYLRLYYQKNKELIKARSRAWSAAHPEQKRMTAKKYRESNPEIKKEDLKRLQHYVLNNAEKIKLHYKSRKKINSEHYSALQTKRYYAIKQQTPKWANIKVIQRFYKERPAGMTVDHIIPILGKNVSGLHVEWNLQYLTMKENCKKSNLIMEG
jgi:5-methylcytosine-specific restriction endonuclease McrA